MAGQDRVGARRAADDRTGQGRCTAAAEDRTGQEQGRRAAAAKDRAGQGQEGCWGRTKILYRRTGKQTSCCVRKEREEEKKERSGRRLLLRISIAHSASLHIPSSRSVSLHIPSSRIPDGTKGRGLAGTRRDKKTPIQKETGYLDTEESVSARDEAKGEGR